MFKRPKTSPATWSSKSPPSHSEPAPGPTTASNPTVNHLPGDNPTTVQPTHQTNAADTPSPHSFGRGNASSTIKVVNELDGAAETNISHDSRLRISMDIPTGNLFGLDTFDQMAFSNRGSILLGGKKSNHLSNGHTRTHGGRRRPSEADPLSSPLVGTKVLSADEEMLSRKLRSMYDVGEGSGVNGFPVGFASMGEMQNYRDEPVTEDAPSSTTADSTPPHNAHNVHSALISNGNATKALGPNHRRESMILREEHELAGGIEDWENVDGRDVDRYGFIVKRKPPSTSSSAASTQRPRTPEPQRPHRVSTVLQLASDTPRRKRSLRRSPSNARTSRSNTPQAVGRKASSRSLGTSESIASHQGSLSQAKHLHPWRTATNRLPGNRERRWVDEAGDMLTLPPGLADIAEDEEGGKHAVESKRKESERTEKWRKMAKAVKKERNGRGMEFCFDTDDPKLISRTWKGIPDRWRATAWHGFLSNSARKRADSLSDEAIIARYHDLLAQSSADDVQIDLDVPRTINGHIMFRRRYRGGQRLLFRVLHSLSLYFPDTGYVQGMASLAATLLCYYDEDMTFVMLVRLWQLRGLERLYQSGFQGLMDALKEFETEWLADGEVGKKLTKLGIDPTAYGTRWYLTLFNYSIPFPAQLRVWDVFMLLGDPYPSSSSAPSRAPPSSSGHAGSDTTTNNVSSTLPTTSPPTATGFSGALDVLHATSAALIDGTRDILLDSDFENAMKVLTSWVPIRDEDLLMRVARAEWKMKRRH
ncbi:MAG: hypothetical protein M1817_001977 [Caeruleum heppii]|nr:MAG: hypothetical protein M1817_001977 [Caeruleum heppii]